MRQPPEKLLTGASSCSVLKPRPISSAWARDRASKAPASANAAWASAMAWPSLAASARQCSAGGHQGQVAFQHEVGGAVVGLRHVLRHLGRRQCRGTSTSPRSLLRRFVSRAKRLDLPAPLRPTRPIFLRAAGWPAPSSTLEAPAQGDVAQRDGSRASRVSSSTWSSPAGGLQPDHFELWEGCFKVCALVADFEHEHAVLLKAAGASCSSWRMKSMPSAPPAKPARARRGIPTAVHPCWRR